jgi:hypothetical protein
MLELQRSWQGAGGLGAFGAGCAAVAVAAVVVGAAPPASVGLAPACALFGVASAGSALVGARQLRPLHGPFRSLSSGPILFQAMLVGVLTCLAAAGTARPSMLRHLDVFELCVVLGAVLGAGLGVALVPLFARLHLLDVAPSLDAAERGLRIVGSWLTAVGAASALVTLTLAIATGHGSPVWFLIASASVLVGLAMVQDARAAQRRRRAWLECVRAGRVEGWRVRAGTSAESEDLPVFVHAEGPGHPEVLVRVAGSDPYRDIEVPYAWTHGS